MAMVPRRGNRICEKNGIPIPIDLDSPYSIDQNLWGRSNECGILRIRGSLPEDAYELTTALEYTPDEPDIIEIDFEQGVPVRLNGKSYSLAELILELNALPESMESDGLTMWKTASSASSPVKFTKRREQPC